jgi:hypothetical protein
MIYYIKTTNKQSLYNALVDCGIAREVEDSHAFIEGAELSEIGAIVRQEKRFVRGDSDEILFETREELVTEAVQEVLWTEDEDLPEGTVAGDVKVPAADAVYKTVKTNIPQMELVFEEVEGEMVPKMSALKMLTLGDIKTPKIEQITEQILIQEAVEEKLWTEEDTLPEDTQVGDIRIVGQEAVYETKVIQAAVPAEYYTEQEVAESGDAYHANLRGVPGELAKDLPCICAPRNPARVWWS